MWFIWGEGGSTDIRGMRSNPSKLGFKIKKYNWLEKEERQIKKDTSSFFIAIPPIERTFCWVGKGGDVCQGLLIQFVPPFYF